MKIETKNIRKLIGELSKMGDSTLADLAVEGLGSPPAFTDQLQAADDSAQFLAYSFNESDRMEWLLVGFIRWVDTNPYDERLRGINTTVLRNMLPEGMRPELPAPPFSIGIVSIPPYHKSAERVQSGNAHPLDEFIMRYMPTDQQAADQFRDHLQAMLDFVWTAALAGKNER